MAKKKEFNKLFDKLDEDTRQIVDGLIKNAEFIDKTIATLRDDLEKNGHTEKYQYGSKKRPEAELYLNYVKQYNVIIRDLMNLLPKGSEEVDELLDFIKR